MKKNNNIKDDTLYGLLTSYKGLITYLRVFEDEEAKIIVVQLTDNPKHWKNIPEEMYAGFRELSRLDIGVSKLSIKYLKPLHIAGILLSAINLPAKAEKVKKIDMLNEGNYLIFEIPIKYKKKIIHGVTKVSNLSPQKKYEIIEKSLSVNQG